MTELLSVASLILSVLVALLLVQKNQAATIAAQEAHLRNELKVRLYEGATETFRNAAQGVLSSCAATEAVLLSLRMSDQGIPVQPTKSANELMVLQFNATTGLTDLLLALEEYEIVYTRFRSIRRRFAESQRRLIETHMPLFEKFILFLPTTNPQTGGAQAALRSPKAADLEQLQRLQAAYADVCHDVAAYVVDLQIEAQNELLGPLLGRELPPRSPLDPGREVLARDAVEPGKRDPGRLA